MKNSGNGHEILDDQLSISLSPMNNKCRGSKSVVCQTELKEFEAEKVTEEKLDTSIRCDKTIDMFPDN